jgi:hypothetical protein
MSTKPTAAEVRAFVGSNSDYYLQAWQPALSGRGRASKFNGAAFFLVGFWLVYRKMYQAAFILCGAVFVGTLLELLLFVRILRMRQPPPEIDLLFTSGFTLVVALVVGACGNGWYLSRARRAIAEVRARGLPEDAHLEAIARRGGTASEGGVLGLTFLLIVGLGLANVALYAFFGQL